MTQLGLDFDAKPAGGPVPDRDGPPDRGGVPGRSGSACILVRELARIARETGRERKILVTRTRGEGKELLRQVALGGQSWAGFEVTTARPLAMKYAAEALTRAGASVIDPFDEQALMEEAIDHVMAGGAGGGLVARFAGLAEKVGFRDAVRNSVEALRLAGIRSGALRKGRGGASRRQILLTAVDERLEELLDARGLADTAVVLEMAIQVVNSDAAGTGRPAGVPIYLVPGLTDRGLTGQFLRALERRGATILKTDPVLGLAAPPRILWAAGPAESVGSHLHAIEQWRERRRRTDTEEDPSRSAELRIDLFAAGSVHDELRGVLRRVTDMGARWDEVEIVASDPAMYGSALHTLADSMGIPVTFAVGLPVERTRPGRVVATYFKWVESGFQESVFRALVEADDVSPPSRGDRIAGPRLARALRRLRIGWGRERYMDRIEAVLRAIPAMNPGRYEDDERFERRKMYKEKTLRALRALLGPVLEATPEVRAPRNGARAAPPAGVAAGVSPAEVATGVKSLLTRVTDGTDTDDTARDRLVRILDRIEATLTRRTDFPSAAAIVKSLLEIRIPAPRTEGAAPWSSASGHLYLTDLRHGGAAGRPFTFVVGLDSARFPGSAIEDPLLLDRERLRLGQGELAFASDRAADARFNFAQLAARLRGTLVLSYARWDPAEARALSPAPELLQALRLMEGDPRLTFEDLDRRLGVTESRLPRADLRADLDACDVWLRALATSDGRLRDGVQAVGLAYPRLGQGLAAAAALHVDAASVHTGIIGERDPPFSYQDQRTRILSASRLEDLGACPRRFLFANVLRVSTPDDPEFDPHRWLDALQRGSLLHNVYEQTLKRARDQGIEPAEDAFLALALELAHGEIAKMTREVPSPSPVVRFIETTRLREDVHSFVEMIRREPPSWIALEMDFGMDDTGLGIPAGDDAPVLVRGRIDRVDDHGTHLRVVDYKTGTDYGHDRKSGVYRGGRRLQHALYTAATAAVRGKPVDRMEYHFPTRRGENRIRRYSVPDLRHGGALAAMMLEGAGAGWFPATDDAADCRYCDYQEVCGVRADKRGNTSCRYAEWTKRNLDALPELSALRRARNWEDEEPLS
ncbi:MAG: PD-(D/E)XK nuclease family protein [Gemmatimonadetes bacterium]|nr:PD-(D/E)XK nuclease family protein [Gemmatimonadota bacterium]MYD13349.1 PD-(D/E)XK nuclease family protein [Gemmatimonadota bacterium]